MSDVATPTEVVERDTASRAAQVRILAAFAVIAFVLAGIGIHGQLSFSVTLMDNGSCMSASTVRFDRGRVRGRCQNDEKSLTDAV